MDPEAGTSGTRGSRIKDQGSDQGSRIKDEGSRIKDQGSRIRIEDQGEGSRIKDHGPCPAMNEHPRRDTDVILRQPKAPVELFNPRCFLSSS